MILPTEIHASVTEEMIAAGLRGSGYTNPISLALSAALHAANPDLDDPPLVAVFRGPSMAPVDAGATHSVDAYEHNIRWSCLLNGQDVPLPRRCQLFLDVWNYGPGGNPLYAIRDKAGAVIARRTFCEIVVPFQFTLSERKAR